MIRRTFFALSLLATLCTPVFADKSQDDLKAMEGTWIPTSGEVGGGDFQAEELKKLKLVMKGDAYTVSADGKDDKGTVKLDATKTPKHLDIMGVEGENKGKTFLAIYEFIDKDTMKACYALTGDRPTEFKTVADDGRVVLTFKRGKASITSPADLELAHLCTALRERAASLDDNESQWPAEQLALCAKAGVFTWFVPREQGGLGWSEANLVRGYLQLSAACLATTFIITQFMGAVARLAAVGSAELLAEWLPDLLAGRRFATLGISHLTTSRRHLATPVLQAEAAEGGYVLDGYSPWVTGAARADLVMLGATLGDGRQILVLLPTDLAGVSIPPPARLVALSASQTGELRCERVFVERRWLLAGPIENVMQQALRAKTGGLQTSTLATGLSNAALDFLERESALRPDLQSPAAALREEWRVLERDILSFAEGNEPCTSDAIRTRANSLVLRATQAALAAAKGSGYVLGHPAGRWCREALFFLVWSCPQGVLNANLCELAGL